MSDQQSLNAGGVKLPKGQTSMDGLWAEAAVEFKKICGVSLQHGDVNSFDGVLKKIESAGKASYGTDDKHKWDKAKDVGLKSLKYLKMLVGVASQASGFFPVPQAATSMTCSALCFVFDIPQSIRGYNEAVDEVFGEVSSALSQFKIYQSMEAIDSLLVEQIHRVMVKFVEVCAHVVAYRQGRKVDRFLRQMKSVFDDESGLAQAMAGFRQALKQQRDVEGTLTLAVMIDTRKDLTRRLEDLGKKADDTQTGVQSIKDEVDRTKMLPKIRDALGVSINVHLDTNTTQTCQNIVNKCSHGTGKWIDENRAYINWTTPKDKHTSHVLLVSGPKSSGKTLTTALITNRLEQRNDRTYVAHYFFPANPFMANNRRSEGDKGTVQSVLKYMAFQIARVDATVLKALGKACDTSAFPSSRSASLGSLWGELKIGGLGSGATYYLVFDGLEYLPNEQAEELLEFLFSQKLARESMGRVRVLVSGTDETFKNKPALRDVLRIQMVDHNEQDMRIVVERELNEGTMLPQHLKLNKDQQRARESIITKLPQKVKGKYSRLQSGLHEIKRLLRTRTGLKDLEKMLDRPISSLESDIKRLQLSITADDISELNELLKWVLFSAGDGMALNELEGAMFLDSDTESLTPLKDIIEAKYSDVFKVEDQYVYEEEGVRELLQKGNDDPAGSLRPTERPTISMTINIKNVDQEICGHFFWDLAQKAIRDKFKFDFDGDSNFIHSSQATVKVDELDAHRTIVKQAFKFLDQEPRDQTNDIGEYLFCHLPHHLDRLRQLEDEGKGSLTEHEKSEVGLNLYNLFKDEEVWRRHRDMFLGGLWWANEIDFVQACLHEPAVVRRLDKQCRDKLKLNLNPTKGFLRVWVKMVVEGFLRDSSRNWQADWTYGWTYEFMHSDRRHVNADDADSSKAASNTNDIDWDDVSDWCQRYLGLPDSSLDSLWYERLAEAASLQESKADIVISLYKRAIDAPNPSWLCHRGLAKAYSLEWRNSEAIAEVELALKEARLQGATPEPKDTDITDMRLSLGNYSYGDPYVDEQKTAEHYMFACEKGNAEQSRKGYLGRLKLALRYSGGEEARNFLQDRLAQGAGRGDMVSVLKAIALDEYNHHIFSQMLAVSAGHPELIQGIVTAMEKATIPDADETDELDKDERFDEDIARGVILYYRGVAAYTHKVSPQGTEPIKEALRLWKECRERLLVLGGINSSVVQNAATTDLAKHYFQVMVDKRNLDYLQEMLNLVHGSSYRDTPPGLLGALFALLGQMGRSKSILRSRVTYALQILSDDTPDNDSYGLGVLYETLAQHQDFRNAMVAISMYGQPDLVSETLLAKPENIVNDDVADRKAVMDMVSHLGKETVQFVKAQVPSPSQQMQRIQVAIEHVQSLLAAAGTKYEVPEVDAGDDSKAKRSEKGLGEEEPILPDSTIATAHRCLLSRLTALQRKHTPGINIGFLFVCDGRFPDGRMCGNKADFESSFYHCIYCTTRDFCGDCLRRLRDPESCAEIPACSAEHRWLKIPPQGQDLYTRSWSKGVRVPSDVRPIESDERILEAHYAADGSGQEVTLEQWKQDLAVEWGIELEHQEGNVMQVEAL